MSGHGKIRCSFILVFDLGVVKQFSEDSRSRDKKQDFTGFFRNYVLKFLKRTRKHIQTHLYTPIQFFLEKTNKNIGIVLNRLNTW